MPSPLVPMADRQTRLLYTDSKGSKLVMYSDQLLGGQGPVKVLQPGRLTDAQRAARTDLLAIPGAQITSIDSGITYESNGTSWVEVSEAAKVIPVTSAQIASPTAGMLADRNATYRLNVAPFTRYNSDGTSLVPQGSGAGVSSETLARVIGGDNSIPSGFYKLAFRASQPNGPLLDQSFNQQDAAPNTAVFPSGWGASQAVAQNVYRSPTNPSAIVGGLPLFKATTGGTTGSSQPAWTSVVGATFNDGTAVWTAEKGPFYLDANGNRQFRSLSNSQIGNVAGSYGLGAVAWNMAAGDSLIISITSSQNYTSGPVNFSEAGVVGNRVAGATSAGFNLIATGQTTLNDLRLRISDGTTNRTAAHLDSSGLAQNRPGDGSRRTTTFCIDGQTKRMYLLADGVPRNNPSHYSGISATDIVAWDADVSAVNLSTATTRPVVFGGLPNADGSLNTTTYEFGASRLDILVLPARGLPADIITLAQWFHNRGEALLPAGLVL